MHKELVTMPLEGFWCENNDWPSLDYMTPAVDPVVLVYIYFIQHIYLHWLKVHDEKDQSESRA